MAGSIMDERKSIRDSAKALKKYGSTSSHIKRQEHFIKHAVTKNDTLQGLALKYGITTEQIRRANRLWTNDSLFLRESLLIPVPSESLSSPSEIFSDASTSPCSQSLSPTPQSFSPTPQSFSPTSPQENGIDDNYNDFLNKIDSAIANTKSQVMLAQGNSNFKEDDDQLFVKRRAPMSRLKHQQLQQQQQQSSNHYEPQQSYQQYNHRSNSASSINSNCSDVPLVMTQGRKVRSSLQRLEQQQDEMFEL